jgi:hypothetical protein
MSQSRSVSMTVAWRVITLFVVPAILAAAAYPLAQDAQAGLLSGSRRLQCASNLKQIGVACVTYEAGNRGPWPTGFTNDSVAWNDVGNTRTDQLDPTKKDAKAEVKAGDKGAAVAVNSNTAGLWLLMRSGLIHDPSIFICPEAARDADTVANPEFVRDFRGEGFCSYSYQNTFQTTTTAAGSRPYILNSSAPSGLAVVADANPMRRDFWSGAPGGGVKNGVTDKWLTNKPVFETKTLRKDGEFIKDPWDLNSPNHDFRGQNVLYRDGHVAFYDNPYAGIQFDNIWTARQVIPAGGEYPKPPDTNNVDTLRAYVNPKSYDGKTGIVGGVRNDSFLVP